MDRIYMNHRHGERRIHVEIEEQEVADLLDSRDSEAARRLDEILRTAHRAFAGGRS
ncbi:hypothetical protein [Streptomyces sp. NPDC056682]|uniref:hypothetical protein n=1 Tax=Streptomyces sp. NPDC056682 TaxID=3345909 RepID=UPI0036CEC6E2